MEETISCFSGKGAIVLSVGAICKAFIQAKVNASTDAMNKRGRGKREQRQSVKL